MKNLFGSKFRNLNLINKIIFFGLIAAAVGVLVFMFVLLSFAKDLPTRDQIINREITQSTKIYDKTGEVLLYEISGGQKRTVIPLSEIPDSLKEATIILEDENFYTGGPVDLFGIARAFLVNLVSGEVKQGGSTITQQLAKNAFLSPERTYTRKIKELLLAVRIDQEYSKDEILELYLNEIPYGPTIYGVEAAAQAYFKKSAKDISLAQSAILASIPRASTYYSPWGSHVDDLMQRQQFILRQMHAAGKITDAELDSALNEKVTFEQRSETGLKAPHFVMAVQEYLADRYGEEVVRGGGLKVITTLDWKLQEAAEKAVLNGAKRNERLYGGKNAALVAQDSNTGQILAMVGSRDYFEKGEQGNFNAATQGLRQPGSALKPFVYLTTFEKGFIPDTVLFDVPTEFSGNSACPSIPNYTNSDRRCFHPQNFDLKFRGPISIRTSLSNSVNITAVKSLYIAGLKNSVSVMNRFGLKTLDDPDRYGLSLVLGGGAVRLIDLVGAYSVLAEEGVKHDQSMVLEVRGPSGNLIESFRDKSENVFDPNYVRMINDVLSDVPARTPLFGGSIGLTTVSGYDVALKTGTSNDYMDAWTMGYTPNMVIGVWAGNNDNKAMHKQGSSILAAVPIWGEFAEIAVRTTEPEAFRKPEYTAPEKPILRGEYAPNGQIHTILYWIDKDDPRGPQPSNPGRDPQFDNWEQGVLAWAGRNPITPPGGEVPPPGTEPPPPNPGDNTAPSVSLIRPTLGSEIDGPIQILADLADDSSVSKIRVYFNGSFVQEFTGDFGPSFQFNWSFTPSQVNAQNTLMLEVEDDKGGINRSGVTLMGPQETT